MESIIAGKFTRVFGKEGEVTAVLYDTFPPEFDKKEPLYVRMDGAEVPLFISRFERRGRSGALFVFDDIDTEARAGLLLGREFAIAASKATRRDTGGGLDDLVGYTCVIVEEGAPSDQAVTGTITDIFSNDANPLFVIEAGGEEILVPAAEDLITGIDPSEKTLYLETPPGLLDL